MSGGSKSRSTSQQSTSTTITSRDTAVEDVDGLAVVGGEGDVTISQLDGGAIQGAFSFAEDVQARAFDANEGALDDALDFGRASIVAVGAAGEQAAGQSRAALNTLSGAINQVAAASRSDSADVLNNIVRWGGIGVAALAVVFLLSRGK